MKHTTHLVIGLILCSAIGAGAAPKRTIAGALLGAGAGLVIGNNVDNVGQDLAVPVMALAGGLIGYHYDQKHETRKEEARTAARTLVPAANRNDLHPGVDLIKISIVNRRGVRLDIPVLRTAGAFYGPQGEKYEELPSTAALTEKYGQ